MREKRAIAGALIGSVVCVGAAWGVLAGQSGCQLQSCEFDGGTEANESLGFRPVVVNGVWQSGPINGTWVPFPAQAAYAIFPHLEDGGPFPGPYEPYAMVSPDPNPYTTNGSNFTQSAGNIAEFAGNGADGINVFNDTCSQYYLWISLTQVNPAGPGTPSPLDASQDGPTTSDASAPSDASTDATTSDASTADATGD